MNRDEIFEILSDILVNKLKINENLIREDNFDEPLMGNLFGFNEITLGYVYLEVQKIFEININGRDLDNYGFCTINKIVSIIEKYVESESLQTV